AFSGSQTGQNSQFTQAALALTDELHRRAMRLVYGGGDVGLMGVMADRMLALGGEVVGVIPRCLLEREVAHHGVTELHVVETMHARKALMAERSDGFIAIPGGFGTLEELFEVVTWRQLRIHSKPCGILNVAGYYDGLLRFLDRAVEDGFIRIEHRDRLIADDDPARLLDRLQAEFSSDAEAADDGPSEVRP
ncbi:MAG: TIGR00730 family Rossman fold protein, partial [Planctomycetaceae bacterium]|nr:TIGR00730 family Rossman fold protein [Planctomycetaceae bacterium]